MNFSRYKFSKHSEPELVEFFKVVTLEKGLSNTSEHCELWKQLLPEDPTFCNKFKPFVDEVIEVIDDSYTSEEEDKKNDDKGLLDEVPYSSSYESEDFIVALQEYLETEETISEDMIKHLDSICSKSQHQEALKNFTNSINSHCLLKLWKSITTLVCAEQKHIVIYFIHKMLTEKILTIDDKIIKTLLNEVCDQNPAEISAAFVKTVFSNQTSDFKILNKNLGSLQDHNKNLLLSQFKCKCLKLELCHIGVVNALLYPKVDTESIIKLVELMCNVADDYAEEKTFGKLILNVIQILESNAIQIDAQMAHLVNSNKSVFKVQAINLLEKFLPKRFLD